VISTWILLAFLWRNILSFQFPYVPPAPSIAKENWSKKKAKNAQSAEMEVNY
jgi:hypothetical protein